MTISDWFNGQGSGGQEEEQPQNSGYVPAPAGEYTSQWLIPEQTNPVDMSSNPDTPYGLPENWHYQTAERGPSNELMPTGAVGWTPQGMPYFGGQNNFDEWRKGLSYRLHKDTVNILGKEMNITPVFRAVGETLMGFGMALGRIGEVTEQAISLAVDTPDQFEKAQGITSWLDEPLRDAGGNFIDWRDLPEDGFREKAWKLMFNGAAEIANGVAQWRVLAGDISTGQISTDELTTAFDRQWAAGQIAYTGWVNDAVTQEYMRRYDSGENPYLLAEELQYVGVEVIGEMILDPLNLLDFITKGNKAASALENARETVADPLPEIADAMKVLNAAADVADEARYTELLQPAIMKSFGGVGEDLTKLGDDVKFWGLVQEGKQNYIQSISGNFFQWVAKSTQEVGGVNPDNTLEIMRGLVKMSSSSGDEVMEGYALVTSAAIRHNLPADVFLSRAAAETSQALRMVMTNSDGVFDASKYAETIRSANTLEELIDIIVPINKAASEKLFPTLAQRAEELTKAGESLDSLGFMGNTMLKMEKVASNPIYRGVNSAFARLYMGMNPGYVVRNGITNTMHILVDQGLGAFVDSAEKGGLPKFWLPKANKEYIQKKYGVLPEWVQGGIGAVGEKIENKSLVSKITGVGLEVGGKLEDTAGQRVLAHSTRQSLTDLFQPGRAIPEIEDLVIAGLPEADAKMLQRMLGNRPAETAEVMADFTAQYADGAIDTFKAYEYVSPQTMKTMRKYEMWDDFVEFADGFADTGQKNGWPAAVEEFFGKYDFTDDLAAEIMPYPLLAADGTVASHHIDSVTRFSESGHADLYSTTAYAHQMGANKIADESVVEFSQNVYRLAEQQGIDIKDLMESSPEFRMIMGREYLTKAQESNRVFSESVAEWSNNVRSGNASIKDAWRGLGLDGDPPDVPADQFLDFLWDGLYRPERRSWWAGVREFQASAVGTFVSELRKLGFQDDHRMLTNVQAALDQARLYDQAIWTGKANMHVGANIKDYDDIIRMGALNGAFTASESGATVDHLLHSINAYLPPDTAKYSNMYEVPFKIAEDALSARAADKGKQFYGVTRQVFGAGDEVIGASDEAAEVAESVFTAGKLIPSPLDMEAAISPQRYFYGQFGEVTKSLNGLKEEIVTGGLDAWGVQRKVFNSESIASAMTKYGDEAMTRQNEALLLALTVAKEKRDFTLLNYAARRNIDTFTGMIFPYQFFHGRTYVNWGKRMIREPNVIKNYMKYRKALEVAHAGAPDWWKYNVSTNELLGLDAENPLYLNLEATINPLNGLLGVDFDDPARRVDWKSNVLMDLNSFGPSTHTLFSIANAISLHFQGEEDAASRWAGRLIPQTNVLGAIQSLVEQGFTIPGTKIKIPGTGKLLKKNISSMDPMVAIFSGGVDPYTAKRVDRSMHAMVDEGVITTEQGIDALTQREGEVYEMALERAINQRAAGQISSFFLGVGFKGRSSTDIDTDKFYEDYNRLWNGRDLMNQDGEFRTAMDNLFKRYPFGEMLLIGRKAGVQRDTALAYHVLGRIPPGQSDLLEFAGLSRELVNQFYNGKGVEGFESPQDYERFMAGILDVSATLAIPGDATRDEWNMARAQYAAMNDRLEGEFGEDITDLMGFFYSLPDNQDQRDKFIQAFPQVQSAMDRKSQFLSENVDSPMSIYYGGYDKIESYWRSSMFAQLEKDYGEDIFDIMKLYSRADRETKKALKNQYPQIQGYFDAKDKYQQIVNENVVRIGSNLGQISGPDFRDDIGDNPISFGQQEFISELDERAQDKVFYSTNQWAQEVGEAAILAALKSLSGADLTDSERKALDNAAYDLNIPNNQVVQLIGISVQREAGSLQQ